jgi:hypothetical protein
MMNPRYDYYLVENTYVVRWNMLPLPGSLSTITYPRLVSMHNNALSERSRTANFGRLSKPSGPLSHLADD